MTSQRLQVPPPRNKYLVIGGYGVVGRVVCEYLGAKFPGRVVAAGRNMHAASAFASSSSGRETRCVMVERFNVRGLRCGPQQMLTAGFV